MITLLHSNVTDVRPQNFNCEKFKMHDYIT